MLTDKKIIFLFFVLLPILLLSSCRENSDFHVKAVVDKPAPDFHLKDSNGKYWRLSDLRGNVIFLNFWATWCPPCREEMPSMQALNQSLEGKPFKMITILANDDPKVADKFLQKLGVNLPVLIDEDDSTIKAYGVTSVPESFIIDTQGVLRSRMIGGRNWDSPVMRKMLQELMPLS
ncbi:MAG: TlpA family protein disulfide reductase [Proteobacteria bacterium]|nr:TlpA family protein disulfide reductase [Pseudomonadota bacterium]MBU1709680.1 TlpA family protein disulfide reductase [Pseudomonadota bacterium]